RMKRLTDDARGDAEDIVLRVAEIEEAERLHLGACGAELQPFAPARTALHAVDVGAARLERGEAHLMVERLAVFVLDGRRRADDADRARTERRAVDRGRDFRLRRRLRPIRTKRDRHLAR